MLRDTGFAFTKTNGQDTVTIKVQVHWDHGTDRAEIDRLLMLAFKEATANVGHA